MEPPCPLDVPKEPQPSRPIPPASHSFKFIKECPLAVVMLFQSNRKFVNSNIVDFVPLIIEVRLEEEGEKMKI